MDRAIDARLRWLDGNLPRLVMPMNKCRTDGEEAKEGSNERSALDEGLTSWWQHKVRGRQCAEATSQAR